MFAPRFAQVAMVLEERPFRPRLPVLLLLLVAACRTAGVEGHSLSGAPLVPVAPSPEARAKLEAELAEARAVHRAHPDDESAAIWHGRRLAYLGRYREALAVYGAALEQHPRSHRLRRHRGHRYLTLRRLAEAEADLARAAELCRPLPDAVEPDGAPNAFGIPRSTEKSNVFYHLGLARWLRGDAEGAWDAWQEALPVSRGNDDMLCATTYWLALCAARTGRADELGRLLEPIHADMEILENEAYHRLLLHFRGELDEAEVLAVAESPLTFATTAYGLATWRFLHGDREGGRALWERIVSDPTTWTAFGHLAAEAELNRQDGEA